MTCDNNADKQLYDRDGPISKPVYLSNVKLNYFICVLYDLEV